MDEQASLRRVATQVARAVAAGKLFGSVTEEVGRLLDADLAGMIRYGPDDTLTAVATWAAEGEHPEVPGVWPLEGATIATTIVRTRRSAREDDWAGADGPIAAFIREELGVSSSVGSPIIVEGDVWGALFVHSTQPQRPLPRDTESRLAHFTELVATAIANAQARAEVQRLADEQAALRRVATLVARESSPEEVFAAVAEELGRVLELDDTRMFRFEAGGIGTVVASWGRLATALPVGSRIPMEGESASGLVSRTGRPARVDDFTNATGAFASTLRGLGTRSAAAAPIVVEGRLWGAMATASLHADAVPAGTEARMGQFTELVATAISSSAAREQLARLAEEQAALRRVATLVARGAPPAEVFEAVTAELGRLLRVGSTGLVRFENDDMVTIVAGWGRLGDAAPVGTRLPVDRVNVISEVARTGRPARIDDIVRHASGPIAEHACRVDTRSAVGGPILVAGRLWGAMIAAAEEGGTLPPDTEPRLAQFSELIGTAIANADGRDQLTTSRARLLTAGDEARRRVVLDLHDGAQQRLVHTILALKLARQVFSEDTQRTEPLLAEALEHAEQANASLRELAHGILPSVLTQGGLRAGIDAIVSRLDLPVAVDVPNMRLPPEIEASAYFIVAEALTNVIKHSQASMASVTVAVDKGNLSVEVRDDGVGEADPEGHGLLGLSDRAAALGGRLRIESPRGSGTVLAVELPLSA